MFDFDVVDGLATFTSSLVLAMDSVVTDWSVKNDSTLMQQV